MTRLSTNFSNISGAMEQSNTALQNEQSQLEELQIRHDNLNTKFPSVIKALKQES